ncbi:MAG: tRNA (adenosine(37)-N6)-threonylcarbamoyltransferase complex dimerization subunit type 1 TsaB [Clostridia bacterium]|nr:tRNA (adenosine(37)-N6)-threonylcarbamoyltransferase complex dimerization subunit type 1 TsaB [Clostridia bacterium]
MNILMIDTSGPACSVAVMKDGQIICELQLTSGKTHSQRVMPMVDQALTMCEMTVADIDLFGAVAGPGSFTGVRIGVSSVKALAHAAGEPCIGVDALEALAANVSGFDGLVCPILDARAQQVYGAMFESGMPPVRIMDDEAEKLTVYLERVKADGRDALFLGDGAAAFETVIREQLGDKAHFAPAHHAGLRAASACALAAEYAKDEANLKDCMTLLPLYLRAPQAERERAAKLAAQKENANG